MTLTRKREIEQETMRILSNYRISENPGKHLQKIIAGEKIVLIDYHDWSEEICGRFLFIDNEPAKAYVAANQGLKILDSSFADEEYAICVKKGNSQLKNDINKALKELKDDGTIDKIVSKYIK